ncbi:TPA: DNA circularization protein [Pasteurella multocida]|uniref:DNA circularization protein n=2 Tax=Pasteurella multocida TaxID=747 RepID=UPI00027B1EA8|nr:DNA circularization N-terminal domain-containing protein [Pasteurella multocida]APB78616.1 DNA circularization protein [Pasteurella multocida]ATC22286.1 DNA circularization protein [Pasteurella multocida]EJS83459.1 putative DNA circulation protein [Pasteurella multocida subsp. multocida str. P52VAC]EPE76255.1 DNA circulation protein [Pasteurella multocida 1500C]ERL41325.1 DNA circulation protein [Pasteurella multocida subsp. multocida str. PMTB]
MTKMTGKGSYRGVPFWIEDEQSQNGGRRVVTHEYPLRNDGLTEDLGKRLRHYSVSCLVIGDDHIDQAEALVDALEADGAGTLKHPYFGTLEVRVDDYRMRHSTAHQRVTRFDITFLPALDSNAPEIAEDTAYSVFTEYENVLNSLADGFAEMVEDVSGFIESMVDNPLFRLVDTTMGFIENVFEGVANTVSGLTAVKDKALSIKNRLYGLLLTPKVLARELQDLTKLNVKSAVNSQRQFVQHIVITDSIDTALSNLTSGKTEISKSTLDEMMAAKTNNVSESDILSRQFRNLHEQEIFDALMNKTTFLLKRLVLSTLAVEYGKAISDAVTESVAQKAVTESTVAGLIESKADVQRYITDVDEQLEAVILDNADAEQWKSYQVLETYRLILLKDLRVRGERLANAADITLKDTFPAVLLEYQHTGNAVTWKRLALRNGIAHPLFCLGGSTIEVLQ